MRNELPLSFECCFKLVLTSWFILLFVLIFGVTGCHKEDKCSCRAVEGCEEAAFDIYHLLEKCERELKYAVNSVEIYKNLFEELNEFNVDNSCIIKKGN